VPQAAAEPVESPDDQGVGVAEPLEARVELRPGSQRPGPDVLEDPLDAGGLERVELERQVLSAG
jgi:hypothetical protein